MVVEHASITGIPGVHVAHLTIAREELQTGLTILLPYPLSVRNRKLFIAAKSLGTAPDWTSRQVAEDFATFSSPMVLCNTTTLGIAYDAMITFGHLREKDLPIDNAWPPLVIALDDGYLNDQLQQPIGHDDVLQTLNAASPEAMPCGSVGIGRGLCAFDGKGGVGDALAEAIPGEREGCRLGLFVAANGGHRHGKIRSLRNGFVVIAATDAPLFPIHLRQLAAHCAATAVRYLSPDQPDGVLALAFSTGNPIDNAFSGKFQLFDEKWPGKRLLQQLLSTVPNCLETALRKALAQTDEVTGRLNRRVQPATLPEPG